MNHTQHRRLVIKSCLAIATLAASGLSFAEGGTLADIKKRGQLTVGTEAAYEPYEFVEDGKVVGYGRDLLEIMAAKLGVKLVQQNLPFQGLLPGLLSNRFDFVATSVGVTEERAKRFAFTQPVGIVRSVFVVNAKNPTAAKPADAVGKRVGTQMGSMAQPMVQAFEKELQAKQGGGFAELKLFQAYPDVGVALSNGTLDIGVLPYVNTDALSRFQFQVADYGSLPQQPPADADVSLRVRITVDLVRREVVPVQRQGYVQVRRGIRFQAEFLGLDDQPIATLRAAGVDTDRMFSVEDSTPPRDFQFYQSALEKAISTLFHGLRRRDKAALASIGVNYDEAKAPIEALLKVADNLR